MPNPFVKLWKYFTASANAQIDEKADPKIQIAQAIEAEQQRHQALANQAAAVLGNQRQLEMRLNRQLGEVEKLQASARQALVLADKSRAKGDAAKAAEYENAAQAFATQLVAAEQAMEDLKRSHDEALQAAEQARGAVEQSRMRLQTELAERTKLMSQLEQAKMQEHVAASLRQVNELSAPGNTPSLNEVRDKIEAPLRQRAGPGGARPDLGRGPHARGAEGHPRRGRRLPAGADPRLDRRRCGSTGGRGQPGGGRDRRRHARRRRCSVRPPPSRWPSRWSARSSPRPRGRRSAGRQQRLRVVRLAGAGLRVDRRAGRLAARAPPGDALLQVRALVAEQDRRPAAAAGPALAPGDPVVLARGGCRRWCSARGGRGWPA